MQTLVCCVGYLHMRHVFYEIPRNHNLRIVWPVWDYFTLKVTMDPVLSANSYGTYYYVNVEYVQHEAVTSSLPTWKQHNSE